MGRNAETRRTSPLTKALTGQKAGRENAKTMHIPPLPQTGTRHTPEHILVPVYVLLGITQPAMGVLKNAVSLALAMPLGHVHYALSNQGAT